MSIITSKLKCLWKSRCILGEGTLWVSKLNSILFVDIKKKKIFILNVKTNKKKILRVDKEIGFISHIKNNIFLLGLKSELRAIDIKKKKIFFSINIELEKKNNRINDGKIDPNGRLWFGTMDNLEKKRSGSLYCLDSNLKLTKVDDGYFITNGPAFLDGKNFYHADSIKRTIYKIRISNKFKILKKTIFIKEEKKNTKSFFLQKTLQIVLLADLKIMNSLFRRLLKVWVKKKLKNIL